MGIFVIGLNHKTADIELRERLAFDKTQLSPALQGLLGLNGIQEAVILSTCNRVELYIGSSSEEGVTSSITGFLSEFHKLERDNLKKHLYIHSGLNAVRHVFRVASSLDSMVLGEPQILGQLKDAYDLALKSESTGLILNKLMKKAISVAKRIRTETKISENAVSISYTAVELAKKIFQDLSGMTVMLLGAGEMAELAARHLNRSGVERIMIANRTYERAVDLAKEFSGRPVRFEEFKDELIHTDIVICSTGANDYVLKRPEMERIMKNRRHKPMFLIDISVPRNLDPAIEKIDNVYLYDIDNLQEVVDANMNQRLLEAHHAEDIVTSEVEVFNKWMQSLDAVPTIVAIRNLAEAIRKEEVERLLNRLNGISEKDKRAIEAMAASITNKLIHYPTVALKGYDEERDQVINTINRIYGLVKGE